MALMARPVHWSRDHPRSGVQFLAKFQRARDFRASKYETTIAHVCALFPGTESVRVYFFLPSHLFVFALVEFFGFIPDYCFVS